MRNFAVFLTFIIVASASHGQSYQFRASFGEDTLASGFQPDPYTVEIDAGGIIDAEELAYNCFGMIADDPDFRLVFEASDKPLYISVSSSQDTTLVVSTPSGEWICDDDTAGELNPLLVISITESGPYDIWVGTIGVEGLATAVLSISEFSMLRNDVILDVLPDLP